MLPEPVFDGFLDGFCDGALVCSLQAADGVAEALVEVVIEWDVEPFAGHGALSHRLHISAYAQMLSSANNKHRGWSP